MDSYQSTVIERTTLTFCLEGLAAREELLVKALIRLLDHLTHQQWRYQPPDGQASIDLLLAAPGTSTAFAARYGKVPGALLELSNTGGNGHGRLSWPLRPDALEKELNRLGGLAGPRPPKVDAPHVIDPTHTAPILPASVTSQADSNAPDSTPLRLMRLLQWPPGYLLASPGRMRLATLLTGKAMALDELAYRSKLPVNVCQSFVKELDHVGLLIYPKPPLPGSADELRAAGTQSSAGSLIPASPLKTDLSAVMPQQTSGAAAMPPRSKHVPTSLLTRIRMRLGIGSLRS